MSQEIILFADPMCSWCWGFSPVIGAIDVAYGERAPVSVVVGGLRPGTTWAMDEAAKRTVRHHWEQVGAATGQPFWFWFDFFERQGFVYDTEPACRAMVTGRTLKPEATLGYLDALHRAFYVDGRDVTGAVKAGTIDDFRLSHRTGISGFPTVVLRDEPGDAALGVGYRPLEALAEPLETWLEA